MFDVCSASVRCTGQRKWAESSTLVLVYTLSTRNSDHLLTMRLRSSLSLT